MEENNDEISEGIGQIGDKYIILQKLSYGGQANVFSVKEIGTNNIYAAKIPLNDDDSLEKEIKILNLLELKNTPNIINKIDSGKNVIIRNGREPVTLNYLILKLASKRSLVEYISFLDEGFGETYSKVIFYKIVKNIQNIHKNGISHRDIKVDNILLDGDDYNLLISDFGHSIEYSPHLSGIAGTRKYRAPEINGVYDGYKIDVFSLGITLMSITYGVSGFEKEPINSILYKLVQSKEEENLKIYWEKLEGEYEIIKEATDEFKNLFYNMIEFDPEKRYTIEQALNHKWFGEIPKMTPEQLKQYEEKIKLKEEFKRRESKVSKCFKNMIKAKNERSDKIYFETHIKKSSSSNLDEDIFKGELNLKYIKADKYMNYFIYIEGILAPKDFLNILGKQIKKKFQNCWIKTDEDNKPNFNVTFNGEGVFEGLKEKIKQLGNKKDEEDEEDDINKLILRIKLYQTSEGYLLRFVKKQGDKSDFFKKFAIIKNIVEEII